jgi:hypothetical protein
MSTPRGLLRRDMAALAAATGLAGIALFAVSVFIVPTPPRFSRPAHDVTSYLANHGGSIRAAQYTTGLAIMFFLWFAGALWGHLRRVEGDAGRLAQIFLAGAVALAAVFIVRGGLIVVASRAPADDASIFFFRLAGELEPHTSFLIGPMVGALGVLILRHGGLPRTLGWFCAIFALYEIVEGACLYNADGWLSPGGVINRVGPLLFTIWAVWTSGALVQAIGSSRPRSDTTPRASVL